MKIKREVYFFLSVLLFSCNPAEGLIFHSEDQLNEVSTRSLKEKTKELAIKYFNDIVLTIQHPIKNQKLCGFFSLEKHFDDILYYPNLIHKKFNKSATDIEDQNFIITYKYLSYKMNDFNFTILGTLKKEQNNKDNIVTISGNIAVSFPHSASIDIKNLTIKQNPCGGLDSVIDGHILYSYPYPTSSDSLEININKEENKNLLKKLLQFS